MFRMPMIAPLLLLAAPVLLATPAATQTAPDTENGRYSLNRTDDGYLRLDQQTGHVSVCSKRELGWACHPVPDERAALEEEIVRLQKENAALKKEMLARGLTPGAPQSKAQPGADGKSKTEAEIDNVMAVAERLWRRFVEMIQRLQREPSTSF